MRIVCTSDLHRYPVEIDMPPGDILVVAGDLTFYGLESELRKAGEWIRNQPYKHKIVIAGNHDMKLQSHRAEAEEWLGVGRDGLVYLQDEETTIEGLRFYGTPWTVAYGDWGFQYVPGRDENPFARIPEGIDVLISHSPARWVRDYFASAGNLGSRELLEEVRRVCPGLHVFGHIHEGYGMERAIESGVLHVNAAVCDGRYSHTNPPQVVVYDPNPSASFKFYRADESHGDQAAS